MSIVLNTLILFFIIRIVSLVISISNERRLKKQGAVEHGKVNSIFLSLAHVVFYVSSFYEAYKNGVSFNNYSEVGFILLVFAYIVLFYIIYELREIWTVKIYIAPQHKIIKSFLFRTVRHPNYFLNLIPEILGVGLLCNAWMSLMYILPIYIIVLTIRIIQEENAMRSIN